MKISVAWLNTYLDQPVEAAQIETLLTNQGFPIDDRCAPSGDAGDLMLDVEVTSNRPDCLSHLGLAREVAAGARRAVVEPDDELSLEAPGPAAEDEDEVRDPSARTQILFPVCNEAEDLCPLYTARVIRGVTVGPSPDWLVTRLEAIGLRSVNNIVDVTNFVLHELGQPLHAFDLAQLQGNQILVRRAEADEPFVAIDGSKHQLGSPMLVIADADRPVAIAGVMGGLNSEVTETTTDILLESAVFDPLTVRRTSRTLKLSSDSSYRFERGVDPLGVGRASRRAAKLIQQLAGGTIATETRVGPDPPAPTKLRMRVRRCGQLLGLQLDPHDTVKLLDRIGLDPRLEENDAWVACTVPTFRLDLTREVDLIEEVARLQGYDAIPVTEKIHIVASPLRPTVAAGRRLDQVLTAHGYHETVTPSLVRMRYGQPFLLPDEKPLLTDDGQRQGEPMLRPSLLPSLLACRKLNQDAGNAPVRLYEAAKTWVRVDGQIVERHRLALLADASTQDPQGIAGTIDTQGALRDLRGTLEEIVQQLMGGDGWVFIPQPSEIFSWAARVERQSGEEDALGSLGVVDERILNLFDLQTPVVAGEFDLQALLDAYPPQLAVRELPRFPAVERDLSLIVAEDTRWSAIESVVTETQLDRLETLRFLGVYRGRPIPKGHKSVAMRLGFRDPAATLRHEQVDGQIHTLIEQLTSRLDARLRQ